MVTAKIIKLSNGSTTYIPITSTNAIQHYKGTPGDKSYVLLETYLGGLKSDITTNSTNIQTLANAVINAYTKIEDYEKSYVKPVSGHADQIMVYLPTTGTNKYQDTITINNVEHATNADNATNLVNNPTITKTAASSTNSNADSFTVTAGGKTSDAVSLTKAAATTYGVVKLNDVALSGHTHTLGWGTSADNTNKGTEVTALIAVPSSDTSLGTTKQTATFSTYVLPTKKYVDDAVTGAFADVAAALKYKGTVNSNSDLPANHDVGDVWVVATAGNYAGQACEVGDYIVCNTKGTSANNAHWDVLNGENQVSQTNSSFTVGAASKELAKVDGTSINLQIVQEANVTHTSDLTSYVNALNNTAGTGVVTGAKLETNGGGKKLTLSYSSISTLIPNVQDPTANGTSVTFIDTISQTDGKITATKKTVSTMGGATTSAAGAAGLVPQPKKADVTTVVKVLGADGKWKTVSTPTLTHNVSGMKVAESDATVTIDESLFGTFETAQYVVSVDDHASTAAVIA